MASAEAISPDGKTLAAAYGDGIIKLWDVSNGTCLQTFTRADTGLSLLAFAPDGLTLAVGDNNSNINILDVNPSDLNYGACLLSVSYTYYLSNGAEVINPVTSLAFSPDGKKIAAGYAAGTGGVIKFWDVNPSDASYGTCLQTLIDNNNDYPLDSVAFSPDGKTLASGRQNGPVKLWRVSDGTCLKTLADNNDWVSSVAFSPDGKRLASGSFDGKSGGSESFAGGNITLWDVNPSDANYGGILQTLSDNSEDPLMYSSVAFAPDGQTLAAGRVNGTVELWDVNPNDAGYGACRQTISANTYGGYLSKYFS